MYDKKIRPNHDYADRMGSNIVKLLIKANPEADLSFALGYMMWLGSLGDK